MVVVGEVVVVVEVVVVLIVRLVSGRSSPGSSSSKHISKAKTVDGKKCLILYFSYVVPQELRGSRARSHQLQTRNFLKILCFVFKIHVKCTRYSIIHQCHLFLLPPQKIKAVSYKYVPGT